MKHVIRMNYSSSISSLCELNSSFDSGVLAIAYAGENRNGSFISKDSFERSLKTMYNCPVVCNYNRDTDSIGGHDMELVVDKAGNMCLVNNTIPVGVVPESAKHFWQTITEEDGSEHEYLCTDVLIWKRQEAYKKIKEDGVTSHSMEITVKDGHMEDGLFVINDFEFTAFCLLGDGHEPCFESSAVELFSYDDMKSKMAQMMAELKESNAFIDPNVDHDKYTNNQTEGGERVLNEKLALAKEYGIDIESLDFSIEEIELEALKEKFEVMKAEQAPAGDPVEEPAVEFELEGQLREEIHNALSAETVECSWGEMQRYYFIDYDRDASEVYCYDSTDWKMYGFTYSMNGDNVVIDFACKKRKKYSIVDFDEGEQESPIAAVFEILRSKFTENEQEWSKTYEVAAEKINSMEIELEELRQFKANTEKAVREAAIEELFAKFEDLSANEEFTALRANSAEYELDALEEKCFAIRGKMTPAKFTVVTKPPKLVVEQEKRYEEQPYGGLFAKYHITK